MNILVFGKDGQLGKAFKAVFDASKLGELHHITYVGRTECDLANADAVTGLLDEFKPNIIVNAAAYTAVDKAETEVDLAYAINTKAPEAMAVYAKRHSATFLHYSTDYVFDGSKKIPYIESDARNPLGVYGKSKAAGEEAIENVFKSDQASLIEVNDKKPSSLKGQYAIFRTSWVYGDGDNFIRTILRLAKERETLKVVADQYGVPTSATWLAEVGLALVLDEHKQLKPFQSGIYHVVPQGETTRHVLACHVIQVAIDAGAVLKLHPNTIEAIASMNFPMIAPRPMNSRLSVKKLEDEFTDRGSRLIMQLFDQLWAPQVAEYVKNCISTDILKADYLLQKSELLVTRYQNQARL
jgi:dTDP-4-dehydrorhamnose reductase